MPFSPLRRTELQTLVRWVRGTVGVVWLVTGGAGSGKTRLLVQTSKQLTAEGWECGWVQHGKAVAAAHAAAQRPGRVLLLVDDVDASPRQRQDLAEMLKAVAENSHTTAVSADNTTDRGNIAVVLAAREFGDWWVAVRAGLDPADLALLAPDGHTRLSATLAGAADQAQLYETAVRHYARYFGVPTPPAVLTGINPGVSLAELHAAAAITAHDGLTGPVDLTSALSRLFTSEEAWWLSTAAQHTGLTLTLPVIRSVVAAATLIGADNVGQAARRLHQLPGLGACSTDQCAEIALWLRQLYGQRGGQWLDLHLPTQLAERYAALCAATQPGLAAALAAAALVR